MKSLPIISLIPFFLPVIAHAIVSEHTSFNIKSDKTHLNKQLHIYDNTNLNKIQLTGNSCLTIKEGSTLSNSLAHNDSMIHLFFIQQENPLPPFIHNTQIMDKSTLTMETNAVSSGDLFIDKEAQLNIIHFNDNNAKLSLGTSKILGNVRIQNLNLAGKAWVRPTSELLEEYGSGEYQQPFSAPIATHIDNLTMHSESILNMQGSAPHSQYNQLYIKTLSGNGTFMLSSNLARGLSDKIVVSHHASGHFGLAIEDSGDEPITPQRVDLIRVNSGDADFTLRNNNGRVEMGVWQYSLHHEQTEDHRVWFLSTQEPNHLTSESKIPPEKSAAPISIPQTADLVSMALPVNRTPVQQNHISYSAQAVINMASASRYILATEMSTFRQRISKVRHQQKNHAFWTRYLNDNSRITGNHNTSYYTHLQGLQIGLDNRTEWHSGDWLLGTFISDSNTKIQSKKRGNGEIRSQSGSLYATWLDYSGFYWDNVFKLNKLRHRISTEMNNGMRVKGHYHQHGLSIASEAGYPIQLPQNLTLTPYGKLSYFRTSKVNHMLDNGLVTTLPQASSLDGETGVLLETPFNFGKSRLCPYLKATVSHELVADNSLTMNGVNFHLPGTGTLGKYGLGSTLLMADGVSVWAELDYQKGNKIESPINASLGLRASF